MSICWVSKARHNKFTDCNYLQTEIVLTQNLALFQKCMLTIFKQVAQMLIFGQIFGLFLDKRDQSLALALCFLQQ